MSNFANTDYFSDAAVCADPYPFFEYLRSKGPVYVEPHHGVAIITGQAEALAVSNDSLNFSACVAAGGPQPPLSFVPEGDDISAQIEKYRDLMPSADLLVTYDLPEHPRARSLLLSLFTPRRLKENEIYLRKLAERLTRGVLAKKSAEVVSELGNPFAILVIADLLGVPEEDREGFRRGLSGGVPGAIDEVSPEIIAASRHPLEYLHESFTGYIEDRRATPRGDVLADLANSKYPDGSTPSVLEAVRVAVNLFAAGQETTARLIATTLRILAEQPELQSRLRLQPELIGNFIEEALRLEGPIKSTFRLTRKTTRIGDVELKAGTTVMVAISTVNRDPVRYEHPQDIDVNRSKIREHLAFGRGVHTCPGAALARVETRVMLEQILARTSNFTISSAHHGPQSQRRFEYAPTYLLRGLNELHLEFVAS